MTFAALIKESLIFLFILSAGIFSVAASVDECIHLYSENNLDIFDSSNSGYFFYQNGGWRFNETNNSLESGNQSKHNSSFWTKVEGPLDIKFRWKISSEKYGIGVFQFQIDEFPQAQCNNSSWTSWADTVPEGTHTLKWSVFNGSSRSFTGWIDSLCIRKQSCPLSCPDIVITNKIPTILDIASSLPSPQENGPIITWVINAYDPENDSLFYKFILNGHTVQNWSSNSRWNWNTTQNDSGNYSIEAQIIDNKHSSILGSDDKVQSSFVLNRREEPPVFTSLVRNISAPDNVRAGIIYNASIEKHDAEYIWNIKGGQILSGQGTEQIKWYGKEDSATISIRILDRNGDSVVQYSPRNVEVSSNDRTVENGENLNDLIANTDNTTFYLNGDLSIFNPIYINTEKHGNNRAYIVIQPYNNSKVEVKMENDKDHEYAIALENSSNVSIFNLTLRKGNYGIAIENSSSINISNNIIYPANDSGIYFRTSDKGYLFNNMIYMNTSYNESAIVLDDTNNTILKSNNISHSDSIVILTINITGISENNTVYFNGSNFLFKDSGYQCFCYNNKKCNCACVDTNICNGEQRNGSCINTLDNENIISSENNWIFTGM